MRRPLSAAAVVVLILGLAACGNETNRAALPETVEGSTPVETSAPPAEAPPAEAPAGDATNGEAIFAAQGCGSCHTLAAAGTTGTVGPNLDDAKPDAALVIDRVTNGSGVMPSFAGQLSEQEITDVAAYVVASTSG
jgi:mono/diheme cytochrome c family protein